MLARSLADLVARGARSPRVVRTSEGVLWIQAPGGPRIDLARRPVQRRLIRALVERHVQTRGSALPSRELVALVWPGDRSSRASLENRLWVAVSAMRRLDLGDVLQRDAEGYRLDPAIEVEMVARPGSPVVLAAG